VDGIIIADKPSGWTSFDVVAKIRNLTKTRKVGHSGTLDPMATGLLPIFLGKATKSIPFFINGDKGYSGEMVLGVKTDTGDGDGKVIMTNAECRITNEGIIEAFKKYTGEIMQTPPMYSAVKVNGERLYKLARKGLEVKREARKITIYDLQFTSPHPQPLSQMERGEFPTVSFSVLCSKGTYIRQLVVDIGDDLGCGAYLSSLRRTYAHPFHISQAISLETIITLSQLGKLSNIIIDPQEILSSQGVLPNG
jgi:tRNA pseudouridine55 synthase